MTQGSPRLPILLEDNHLLVIDKPFGLLSQADLSGDLDVLTVAKAMIKHRDQKPGNVFLGLVHRLDRPVGGVMVLAKTSKAAGRLSAQFRDRQTKKIYRATVAGALQPDEQTLRHFLVKDRASRITRAVGSAEQGKRAELRYRVLRRSAGRSLVEVELITGLSHQIRVQLSAVGHPIIGDRKYGSTERAAPGRIDLFAHSLTFLHPIRRQPITVVAEPPRSIS